MSISVGARLGPYEIVEPIGQGGMGQVWKARDTRLNRFVAVKTSHKRFSERFEREARVISSLNHPSICTLYDVGPNFLVMELVEGPTLAERIKEGPIPLEEALRIARQVAEGLEAAHEKGITHRDLKPGNIKIKPDGTVKVLDFGLAKVGPRTASGGGQDPENSPTMSMAATQAGVILGTAAYMAPEQARGKPVDKRADIWAFGVVLYEMVTGKRLFQGEDLTDILASVVKEQPDLSQAPPQLHRLLASCLEKDPKKRLRDIGDVWRLLDDRWAEIPPPAARLSSRNAWIWPSVAAVLVLLLGGTGWALWREHTAPTRATRFEVQLPPNVEFSTYVSVSPDGHKLVFSASGAQSGLWIHDVDTLEWRKLPVTEAARSPFWSPDSRFLGFAVGNDLKKIEVAGGPPQTLCTAPSPVGTGAWGRDGAIVFGTYGTGSGPMYRVSEAGGIPVAVTALNTARGETLHALPTFLPDGKHFLYLRYGPTEITGIYAASIDAKPAEQPRQRILADRYAASYVNGNLFFMRDGTLMVQPFDADKLQLRGDPVPVAEHVATTGSIGIFSVSPAGVLAYRTGAVAAGDEYQPTWFDREGKTIGMAGESGPDGDLRLSPDGTHAAGRDAGAAAAGDAWVHDFARGVRTRLTFRQSQGSFPIWSPDGSHITFAAGNLLDTIYEKEASGAGEEKELLKKPGEIKLPTSWSRDGRFLLYYTAQVPNTGNDLWVLPLEGPQGSPGKPVLLLGTKFTEALGSFSPDARWIAYVSNETGRLEVYVRPFIASGPSGPSLGDGKWEVSKDGGSQPKWRSDGKEIIFGGPNGQVMAVDVSAKGSAFEPGVPHQLFTAPPNGGWDVTADGKRFLVEVLPNSRNTQTTQTPITVVLNWQADLKK
jgi:eukaryotic-like serine/threonine-protein kinase